MAKQSFQIAIDGPVAAGKGTISRLVAQRLNLLYVDTGAMYRVAALLAKQHQIDWEDSDKVAELVDRAEIKMRNPNSQEKDGRLTTVLVDGKDESWQIRTEEMGKGASIVSQFAKVRQVLVKKQQQIAQEQDVVMEGRDITYRVLPQADLKIFLTGSDVVRAKRRHLQLQIRGQDLEFEDVYQDLLQRDQRDMKRANDPLKITADSWVIDSSDLSINQVVELIVVRAKIIRKNQHAKKSQKN
ncbi:MAG: (d)CMP kinase [Candidatus Pacebacteria bacterium]|nr:(d)CMP kinase [Candidatus Paceibacterota bacterium]